MDSVLKNKTKPNTNGKKENPNNNKPKKMLMFQLEFAYKNINVREEAKLLICFVLSILLIPTHIQTHTHFPPCSVWLKEKKKRKTFKY